MRTISSLVAASVALSLGSVAAADGGAPGLAPVAVQVDAPTYTTRSYAFDLLKADALALALIAVSGDAPAVGGLGVATLVLGAPIQHLRRGHADKAALSLLARTALPLAGLAIGLSVGPADLSGASASCRSIDGGGCGGGSPRDEISVIGGVLGFVGASIAGLVLDYKVLARERVALRAETWSPLVAASGDAVTVGLTGGF